MPGLPDAPAKLYVVSDSRGDTGEALLHAALVQFREQRYAIVRESEVRTAERVESIVAAAAQARGAIFYTLVGEATRRAMQRAAARQGVPVVDVLGPALSALHDLFKRDPMAEPGLLYSSEREDFDRHAAIDYTLKHDDGRRPDGLAAADVVLVGVSRSAKSSTCFYLAYQGVKAANVPLGAGPLPVELERLPPQRVIGLWINAPRLLALREARVHTLGVAQGGAYTDPEAVKQEVRAAHRQMAERGWHVIDVSYLAVEETAREILRLRGLDVRGPG